MKFKKRYAPLDAERLETIYNQITNYRIIETVFRYHDSTPDYIVEAARDYISNDAPSRAKIKKINKKNITRYMLVYNNNQAMFDIGSLKNI